MDAVNDPQIETVVGMMASQLGKTDGPINNTLGYFIDHDPAPIMVVQPTIEMAEAWSKDRLSPMLRDTPALRGKVKDPRSRDSGNTILHKQFPGGQLTAVGANAPSGLASRPIRIVLADEIDRYPISAGTEGDPLALAIQRTANFWNRKIVIMSTPTVKGESRIEAAYLEGDQRKYWVPCPHCDEFQIMQWANIQWPEGEPLKAVYRCGHCGKDCTDADKQSMIERGEWRAEKPTERTASFWISALYSPFVPFGKLADEFMKAKGNPERLRAFVNLKLGETWQEEIEGEQLDGDTLRKRAEESDYTTGEIPEGVQVLVCSVDTQNDRLEASIVGFGQGEESWRIDRHVILGDPNIPEGRDPNGGDGKFNVWQRLIRDVAAVSYVRPDGSEIRPKAMIVDTGGGRTQAVYNFAATYNGRPIPIFAIKGSSKRDEPYAPIDKSGRARFTVVRAKNGKRLKLYLIGVHQGKDLLFATMRQEIPGPGYFHLPSDVAPEYIDQLVAEIRVERRHYGQPYHVYELPSGRRNEGTDLEIYARALIRILRLKLDAPPPKAAPSEDGGETPQADNQADEPKKRRGFQTVGSVL